MASNGNVNISYKSEIGLPKKTCVEQVVELCQTISNLHKWKDAIFVFC